MNNGVRRSQGKAVMMRSVRSIKLVSSGCQRRGRSARTSMRIGASGADEDGLDLWEAFFVHREGVLHPDAFVPRGFVHVQPGGRGPR